MAQINRISLVSLLALGLAMPAMAQQAQPASQAPPEDEDTRRGRDVVVVTAQKREETVQDIAIAVTAITSDLRDEIGLTTVQDYTNFAPGLTYSTASDRLGMRGITRTSNNFGIRSGISNYVDGVYFSSAIPAGRAPIFVDRVEVVRGPQGTLYGRDSIGGALNLISKRPTDEFEGQFNIGVGNFDSTKVEMTVAGPITDWLRYRVGGARIQQGEGFLNNAAGLDTEGLRNDEYYVEGQLEGDIGESIDWWVRYGRLAWNREGAPGARTGVGSRQPYSTLFANSNADIGPNAFYGLTDPNRTQTGTQNTNPSVTDRYSFNADYTAYAHLTPTQEIAAETVFHADNFDIKYLGGYVYYNYDLRQDHDNSPISRFTYRGPYYNRTIESARISDYTENRAWFSNELNFISTWDGPLQLVAGAYQYQENYTQTVFVGNVVDPGGPVYDIANMQANLNGLLGAGPATALRPLPILPINTGQTSASGTPVGASLVFHTNNQAVNNAYGAFVQGDYQLNDQWKFTAGIRWSQDILDGREYARVVNHYVIEQALEAGYIPPVAGSLGLPTATAFISNAIPARIDVTSTLGGPDPSTVSAANPCGFAGRGVENTNVTTANSTTAGCAADKTRYGIYRDALTGNAYRDLYASFEEITGVLGVDYTPDDDTLIYGKYNRGYKPGGLGAAEVFGVLLATPFTDKELVNAYELGFKRDWKDWNLTTNAVAFFYDYQGYQVPNTIIPEDPGGGAIRQAPYSAYVNLPQVDLQGFELETMWYPTDNLRFILNYGFTDPKIGETPSLVHALDPYARDPSAKKLGTPSATGIQGQSVEGNLLPFTPKHKIALNGTYTWDLEDGSTLDASLSYFWQDISFVSIFNRSYTKVPSWDQTDGRLSWTNADGNLTLIAWVKNLFDEEQYDSVGPGLREGTNLNSYPTICNTTAGSTAAPGGRPASSCLTTSETLRGPRTIGAELQLRF